MSVSQIMSFIIIIIIIIIIISSVFLHTHSADVDIYYAVMPQTVTALTGSCIQIPCTFNISNFEDKGYKAESINGIWLKNKLQFADEDSFIAFNSSKNIIRGFSNIQMTGNLSERNCTTVFYNIMMNHSDFYYFRLEMEPHVFRATFNPDTDVSRKTARITVKDSPQPPELKPTDLKEVMENTIVNLSCSAEAPCPKQAPTISWSYIPESAHITAQLQEKPDIPRWYSCTAQNKLGKQSSAEIQLTAEGHDGHFMPLIVGCVGGIVTVLTLSALGFCARRKIFNKPRANEKNRSGQVKITEVDYVKTTSDITTNEISDDETLIIYYEKTEISEQQNYCITETLFTYYEYTEIEYRCWEIVKRRHFQKLLLFFDCTALRSPVMSVFQIMSFIIIIIISSVFLHTHSADVDIYYAVMPQTVTALTGSCVQIPCTFNISNFEEKRYKAKSINGIWLKNKSQFGHEDSFIAFNSSKNIIRGFSNIQMTGNLSERNCTTVFYNIMMNHSGFYYFRLEMEPHVFRATFNPDTDVSRKTVRITVKDSPQPPELKPTDLKEVMENTTVNLSCSAEAPCPKQPPTISWSYIPESAHITAQLQEKPDKTQSVFSHMTFKASYMDHRKNISCTATYPRKTSNDSTVETTVMLRVLFSPKETRITIDPSASVSVNTNVTLTCKSKGSPSREMNYTWYKRGQEMPIAQGKQITFNGTQNNAGWYSCTAQNKLGKQSSAEIQLTAEVFPILQYPGLDGHFMPLIAGCVGGIVAVLTLSALGFWARTRTKTLRGDTVGNKDSLNQAQDETIYRNSTYDDVHTVTTQDHKLSDDYSVCERKTEFMTQTGHNTGKDQTEEDNHEKGSDVVYAQVHMIHKKPKAIRVVPEDIYAQLKK
ncbi:uncharacterized protein LOC143752277 [Siphateles boraxobius]|uniref:uncharacterized protein LOC143752277 n=1 Tax=Siphateles boraxobius TaxID=180520 RepID=UPI0040641859